MSELKPDQKDTADTTQKNAQVDENRDPQVKSSHVDGESSKPPAPNELGNSGGVVDTHVKMDSAPPLDSQLAEQTVKVTDAAGELQSKCQVHSPRNQVVNDTDRNDTADITIETVEIGKEDRVSSSKKESEVAETVEEIAMAETTKDNEIAGVGEEKRLAKTEKEKYIAHAEKKNETAEKEMEIDIVEAEKENGKTEIDTENGTAEAPLENGKGSSEAEADIKVIPEGSEAPPREEKLIPEGSPLKEENEIVECSTPADAPSHNFNFDHFLDGEDSGTDEEQSSFMKELENFYKGKSLDFKPPKFYGEGLNCLKLWRQVTRLGGYEQVTSCKLWRQVGESFKPPKTCTTVSWTFRIFYEKALLEYEKHKIQTGELQVPVSNPLEPIDNQVGGSQASGSGRARRDAAARAMQGWHSQRLLGNGEVGDPIIKDKNSFSVPKKDKNLKSISSLKKRKASSLERAVKVARTNSVKPQYPGVKVKFLKSFGKSSSTNFRGDIMVVDVGNPADWVKINVRRTKDCFEVYALVPGLLREEVQVQSDPAGRLIISGEPEQPDNPWGVTPFKKVITLPSRIDPHQTSAVVTLHGQLFVRAPFDQSDL